MQWIHTDPLGLILKLVRPALVGLPECVRKCAWAWQGFRFRYCKWLEKESPKIWGPFFEEEKNACGNWSDAWGFQKYEGRWPLPCGDVDVQGFQRSIVDLGIHHEYRNPSRSKNPSRIQKSIVNLGIHRESRNTS